MERRAITVNGIVQGVGFRPFVYGLAARFGLSGFVKNSAGMVAIEVEGTTPDLNQFLSELRNTPPLAHIDHLVWAPHRQEVDHGLSSHDLQQQLNTQGEK